MLYNRVGYNTNVYDQEMPQLHTAVVYLPGHKFNLVYSYGFLSCVDPGNPSGGTNNFF